MLTSVSSRVQSCRHPSRHVLSPRVLTFRRSRSLVMGASSSSSLSPPDSLELVYFDIAGVAEKVRLAFSLGQVPFTNTKVAFDEWASIKPTTPFGQLPILKIGSDTTIAQSDAMLRYAGTLAQNKGIDLYPQDNLLQIEEALGMTNDIGRDLRPCIYLAMNPTKAGGYPESFKGTRNMQSSSKTCAPPS
ncbi:glutathione s-transferase [Pycnococcus provasolii]